MTTAWVLFSLVALHSFQQDEELGWSAIDRGEFEDAEILFLEVLVKNPEHAEVHVGLGIAVGRQGRYTEALPELKRGAELGSKYEHLDLELGRAHFFLDEYAEAVARLETYRTGHADSWHTHEILGLCYYYTKKFDQAIEALNHPSLKTHPEHEAMYLYHLGLAHAAKGETEKGTPLLEELIRKYPDSTYSQGLRKTEGEEEDLWKRLRRVRPEKWWYVAGGVEGRFDTNPLSLNDATVVPESLSEKDTWVLQAYAGGGARIIDNEKSFVGVDLRHLANWHRNLSSFDQNWTTFSSYAEHWVSERVGITGSGNVGLLWVDDIRRLFSYGAGAGGYYVGAPWTRTRLQYDYTRRDYDFPALADALNADSHSHTVGIAQEFGGESGLLLLSIGYAHTFQEAKGSDYDADLDRVSLEASRTLFWEIRGLASISWTHGDYKNDNSLDAGTSPRDDKIWAGTLRLQRPMTDWSLVYISVTSVWSDSNVSSFDFDRQIYSVGVDFLY